MLPRSGSFMVGDKNNRGNKVSMKSIASLAPARAEIVAWVVAKADQKKEKQACRFSPRKHSLSRAP